MVRMILYKEENQNRHWTEIIKVMQQVQQAAHIQNQRQRNVETASLQNQAASLGLAFLVQAAQDTCIAEVT